MGPPCRRRRLRAGNPVAAATMGGPARCLRRCLPVKRLSSQARDHWISARAVMPRRSWGGGSVSSTVTGYSTTSGASLDGPHAERFLQGSQHTEQGGVD